MKSILAAFAAVALAIPAANAQDGSSSSRETETFRLHPETGCFNYVGDAVEFVGRFRAGAYVSVMMDMIDDPADTIPADETRIPVMDAPELPTSTPESWFGPLPRSGDHSISFLPRAFFGTTAMVTICGRMDPPAN